MRNEDRVRIETLEAFVDAWNRHDVDDVMSFMTPDCVFETSAGNEACGARFVGYKAVKSACMQVFEIFTDARWHHCTHTIMGDRGVSQWLFTGTSKDGARVEANGCDLFQFRDGKIAVKDTYRKYRPNLRS